jgi:glycogen synthase
MRILLVSNLYPPHILGGAEIVARDFAVQLEKLGHDVFILTSAYGLDKPEQDGHTWRTLHYTPAAHIDRQRPLWRQGHLLIDYYRYFHYAANARELQRAITSIQPDVLYIWEITGLGLISMLEALNAVTLPIVYHLESYWLQYALSPQTEQTRLRTRKLKQFLIGSVPFPKYTALIAASSAVKDEYCQIGCDAARIEVIYNGIDERFLAALPTRTQHAGQTSATRLIFAGRLYEEKGVSILLQALTLLVNRQEQQSFVLDIFGDGDEAYVKELYCFVQENHLDSLVMFHGKVPQDELIQQYDRADIMLIPSIWKEPFGLVVAEAMARGLPVITTNIGGPAEIVTHEVDGLLVEPNNAQALADVISRLAADPVLRAKLAAATRITVQDRFTSAANAERIAHYLQQSCAGVGAPMPLAK